MSRLHPLLRRTAPLLLATALALAGGPARAQDGAAEEHGPGTQPTPGAQSAAPAQPAPEQGVPGTQPARPLPGSTPPAPSAGEPPTAGSSAPGTQAAPPGTESAGPAPGSEGAAAGTQPAQPGAAPPSAPAGALAAEAPSAPGAQPAEGEVASGAPPAQPGEAPPAVETPGPQTLDALYRAGRRLERRDPAAAERLYKAILKRAPYHFRTLMALARLTLASRPAEALRYLRVAARVYPESDALQYLLGQALEKVGQPLAAAEAYRQAIYLNPRHYNANARLRAILRRLRAQQSVVERAANAFYANPSLATLTLFGRLVMERAEPRQALLEFEEVRRREPQLPEVLLWIARAQHALGDAEGEIQAYRAYVAGHKDALGVRITLVQRLQEAGYFSEAARGLDALLGPDQSSAGLPAELRPRLAFLRSRLASDQQQPVQAAGLLTRAAAEGYNPQAVGSAFKNDLALFPESGPLWYAYGAWLHGRRQPAQAAEALRKAAVLDGHEREAARALLNLMLRRREAPVAVHLALGQVAFAAGDDREALSELEQVPPGDPLDHRASLLRGRIYRKRGDAGAAVDAFLRYVLFFKNTEDMLYARGNVLWVLGHRAEALAIWKAHPEVLERHPEVLLQVAAYDRQHGDAVAESQVRERLARALPGNQANLVRLGDLYAQRGLRRQAVQVWEKVRALRPRDPDLLERLGRSYLALGEFEKAIDPLERASRLRPLTPDLSAILARALYERGAYGKALRVYWHLLQARPDDAEAKRRLPELALNVPASPEVRHAAARLALADGRVKLAAELLAALVNDQPEDQSARMALAEVYLRMGRPQAAERVILGPKETAATADARRLTLLADIQQRLGRKAGLSETLGRLLALRPDDPALIRRQGLLLAGLRRYADARPLLSKAHDAAPKDTEVTLALAQSEQGLGHTDAAEALLAVLVAEKPDDADALRRLIDLRLKAEHFDAAIPLLERWVAGHPTDAQARYNLISAYLRGFRKEEARPHYEALRKLNPALAARVARYFR